ncbi:hypothetical protein CEUSTIGMA_g12350.t1 [Chlamydomonas eustigma]|uniref:Uncharacterized protein n=1 Tax=Chlamydomonas eustigma TaxID=1157962 RepID=A0A250XPQ4_9CHLO|nr:hypothetical protein CEUSTIGMA_g12350.t1 [Chlamydomonas eustigma]|eukprot:GAX84929.1 hypothetical protein CEUSTIGMA_g12350.t1 [Chlamydomonas eustigma]
MHARLHGWSSHVAPVLKAAVISSTVMSAGDILCQKIQKRSAMAVVDLNRTSRFALVGLTMHGPFFYHGYRWLDTFTTTTGPPSLKGALLKTSIGQVTLFPAYLGGALIALSLLEGKRTSEAVAKLQDTFLSTYVAGSFFWPVANTLNFMFMPPTRRVLFANGAGLIWNAYLSLVNSKSLTKTTEVLA